MKFEKPKVRQKSFGLPGKVNKERGCSCDGQTTEDCTWNNKYCVLSTELGTRDNCRDNRASVFYAEILVLVALSLYKLWQLRLDTEDK